MSDRKTPSTRPSRSTAATVTASAGRSRRSSSAAAYTSSAPTANPNRTRGPRLTRAALHGDRTQALKIAETYVDPANPLRRVRITCCAGWRRDAVATLETWLWCDEHGDFARVVQVDN